jgi:pimeloyl-ACP methyl ester carboxylesterase
MSGLKALVILLVGFCTIGGCSSMKPGRVADVQPYSDKPLAGNAYLLRGFLGIWSTGIDNLGQKIEANGIRAEVYQEKQWRALCAEIVEKYKEAADPEPLVLIGHSYGADDALKIAKELQEHKIKVDLIVTLDPVTPPAVPTNVRLCYNLYQSNLLDGLPFFRGVPLEPASREARNLVNVNLRTKRRDLLESDTDHFNIEKNPKVHQEVVAKLREVCPPRAVWAAIRNRPLPPVAATPAAPVAAQRTTRTVTSTGHEPSRQRPGPTASVLNRIP